MKVLKTAFNREMSLNNIKILYKCVTRLKFQESYDIGVFCRLTNNYALVAPGASDQFYYSVEHTISEDMSIIVSSIGGCRIVGRLSAGNKHGLLLPSFTTDSELKRISEALPESVEVKCIEEKMSALGNIIVCKDHVAMVHMDIDQETREIIGDTLNVEVFTNLTPSIDLPGAYTIVTNYGGLVCPKVPQTEVDELSSVFNIPIQATTINDCHYMLGAAIAANDTSALYGTRIWSDVRSAIEGMMPSHSPEGIQYEWKGYIGRLYSNIVKSLSISNDSLFA